MFVYGIYDITQNELNLGIFDTLPDMAKAFGFNRWKLFKAVKLNSVVANKYKIEKIDLSI